MKLSNSQYLELRKRQLATSIAKQLSEKGYSSSYDPEHNAIITQDKCNNASTLHFDSSGQIGAVETPMGRKYRMRIDNRGNLTQLATPRTTQLSYDYNEENDLIRFSRNQEPLVYIDYIEKGTPERFTYHDSTSLEITYNQNLQPTVVRDRIGSTEELRYSSDGNIKAIVDANGNSTEFSYQDWSQPTQVHFPDGTTHRYSLDPAGKIRKMISASGASAEIRRDIQGNPIEIRYSDGELSTFEYDRNNLLIRAQNRHATLDFAYDSEKRLISETCNQQNINYQYDELGQLTTLTYPDGRSVTYQYDPDQRLTTITDWQNRKHKVSYGKDDISTSHHFPNGLTSTQTNNQNGIPESIHCTDSSSRGIFHFSCGYDKEDRLTSFFDSRTGDRRFLYDANSRIISVTSRQNPRLNERFDYDKAGNRIRWNDHHAAFNACNQIISQGKVQCSFDADGNQTEQASHKERWAYEYNAAGQLVSAKGSSGLNIHFAYDPLGRRISKSHAEKSTHFFWAGEWMIGESNDQSFLSTVTTWYLYKPLSFSPLSSIRNGDPHYYHCDALGTTRKITNRDGRIVWEADYLAFGTPMVYTAEIENNFRFPGQYHDPETGLYYNRYRYYSPSLGRYISRDPLGFVDGTNLYAYVLNNPINRSDPLGLFGIMAGLAVVGIVTLVGAAIKGGKELYNQLTDDCPGVDWGSVWNEAIDGALIYGGAALGIAAFIIAPPIIKAFMLAIPSTLLIEYITGKYTESRTRVTHTDIQNIVDGTSLETLGATTDTLINDPGYERTTYGYVQTNREEPGPDFYLLIPESGILTKEQEHYYRNIEMKALIADGTIPTNYDDFYMEHRLGFRLLDEDKSLYHMQDELGPYNLKLVNTIKIETEFGTYEPGELEVVYNTVTRTIDLSPTNMGTINRELSEKGDGFIERVVEDGIHVFQDMKPYWLYKNTPNDPSGTINRLVGPSDIERNDFFLDVDYQKEREKWEDQQ